MKKRLISLLLAIVMVLGLIPAMAPAANAASNMVAKVEAVGTGYAYDSEEGAFAPTFSSMTAYDPVGNAIDIDGFVWSTPFYTTESFGSANRLFYEPEGGVTYYFAIYVDQYVNEDVSYDYTDSKDLMEKSVVTLPGFDVECISFMEREMQSYLELTYAATRKYHVVEVGDTKLYHGDTYQGSKGGTLTVDGYNVTMNNFKDPSSVYFANPYCKAYYEENRPVFSDMIETLKLTIIGENSVGGMNAMRYLKIYGTMYDSLTIQGKLGLQYYDSPAASSTDAYEDWHCSIYGGNYKMNEIDFSGFYKTEQGLLIYDGASVEVSGEVDLYAMRVENSKLAANSIHSFISQHNATALTFRNSRIELIDRMYHRWTEESDVWAEIYGGAFKGKTDHIELSVQAREGFDCLDFRAGMVGTGSAGSLSGDIKIGGSYHPDYKPFPYAYIDVECKDARSITCKNATASAETAVPGTAVTITADPAPEGKVFYRWEIKGLIKDIANPYSPTTTFTMDVADVQVIATYKDAGADDQPTNPFIDVKEGDFFYDPVMWAVQNGITTGATATTFNPGGTCLRAQVVTFLHRAAGNPEPTSTKNPFTDVKSTDFFYKPVLWAVEKGITNGTSANKFGSLDNCNRAAVVTFLWRAAGSPEPKSTKNPFVDVKTTDFFYKSVLWAVENGITNGLDATHFGPTTACNRAQVVTFLYRAYN